MEQRYLIDSNIVIDYLAGKLPAFGTKFLDDLVNASPNVSVITKIEVLGFATTEKVKSLLLSFFAASLVINLNDPIVNKAIELREKIKIRIPDAIIAATALCENMILVTRNTGDFDRIPELTIINPWKI